jgi:phosphoribosylformylglycinamidine synthase PurS subunit
VKAKIHVFLKPGVLDVQGKAVESELHTLGWNDVSNVRIGRAIEFEIDGEDAARAREEVNRMCERLLANPVIEGYRVEVA